MMPPRILSKSISSILLLGAFGISPAVAQVGTTYTWDGGGGDTSLSNSLNWADDLLPDVAFSDTLQWDGRVAGPLSLVYSDTWFAGAAGNRGVNLNLTAGQSSALSIDSGANIGTFRLNDVTIAAGSGAFSLGNGTEIFNITLGGAGGQTHTWTNNSLSTATVGSDVIFGLGGGGAHTLALGGTGNWTFNNAIAQGNGVLTIAKNGTGALTLTGTSTYTGGLVLNSGTLNINNAGAIGNTTGGALTINGGTIDNTSGGLITTTTAKAQNWNGDFTFAGTNNLSFNGGAVTLGGTGSSRTVNLNGGTLTVGNLVGAGYGLTKTGAGTLAIGSSAVSRITGILNVAGGTIQIAQGPTAATTNDLVVGGLAGSGTIETGNVASRWLFVQNSADNHFSGTLQNGAAGGALGLHKAGTGTLTLTGTNSYTSQTTVAGGTLEFGSASTPGITQTLSTLANTGLVFDRGDSTVKSSFNGTGTASLTFGARVARTAGATGNFIISGGTNGVDNKINLTHAAGFMNQGMFFSGDNYAWMDGANTFVRGMVYGSDAGAVTSGATTTLAAATHQEITGNITAQETATFTTLKSNGNNAVTLASGATMTVNGILKTGNVAGGAVISGGTGIQTTNNGELVIRTDRANDSLTISTPILANGTSSLTTSGAGTLTLSAVNTYTGQTTINSAVNLSGSLPTGAVNIAGGGTLTVTGTINQSNGNNGQINVGSAAGGNAILNINGGLINAGKTAAPSFTVGNASNSSGFVKMTSGTLTTASNLNIGNGTGGAGSNPYAAFTMSGGTLTSGSWLVVGANNDRAVLNQSGGSITVSTNRMTVGAGGNGSVGVVNLSGGTFTNNAGIFLGENGTGVLNVSGTAAMNLGSTGTLQFAGNATSLAGTVNLLGGTISANSVTKGTGTGVYRFNFNGGTLKATANNGNFFASLANTQAYVNSGGANFDTNGFDVTVAQPLLAPVASGLSSIAVASGGVGYLDTPIVTVTGGTGTGAQAVANVSNGVVTGFTITNPGTGYSPGDVLNVSLYGGGATTPATVGSLTLAENVSGGLTKNGAGTLTLNGGSTFTGNVTINQGTVVAGYTIIGNPTTGSLGNSTVAGRTITLNPGTTLRLTGNDVFGNALAIPENLPSLIINGGTMVTTRYNQVGAITLNGATLSGTNVSDTGNYQNYQFLRDVTVGGNAPSFISASGAAFGDGNHLGFSTTFNVADATGDANADLIVSAPFRDQSGNYGISPGSLVKSGVGKMELTAMSTYTGSTTVTGGVLKLSGTGSLDTTSGIEINGNGAKLVLASSNPVIAPVMVTNGAVEGAGTINGVTVADLATNVVGNSGTAGASLTIDSLTFLGAGKISLISSGNSAPLVTTNLTSGAGTIAIDVTNAMWTNGTYDLISYGGGSILGSGFTSFTKGSVGGLGARQSATLGNSGTAITLSIAGDLPVWTGALNGRWTTAVLGNPKNWNLQTGGTGTDFLVNDTVLFDDTATGTTTVDISDANVNPTSATFNNNTKTYTVGSTGGFGIASGTLTKNGTGTLNLGGVHTYTGPTALNAGTTNLTGSLGDTAVSVASGATLRLQAANAISKNTVTVNGTLTQSVDNALSGTAALVVNNGATLTNANTHSGGTKLNAGTLNINNATGIGSGILTLAGGTIDNTSGSSITLTGNNAQVWSGTGFTFKGTNALNLGTGSVALLADTATGSFTLTNDSTLPGASLTIAGAIAPGTGGVPGLNTLNIAGSSGTVLSGNITKGAATGIAINSLVPGTLTLSGAASNITTLNLSGGSGSIVELGAGNLTVANGGGSIVQSTTGGTINASAGGSLVLGSANGDFGTMGGTTLTVNAKISGANAVDFYDANGGGLGTVVLAGANTYTGGTNVENVRLVIPASGSINALNTPNVGQVNVGTLNAAPGVLELTGGTINATKTSAPSVLVGNVAGSVGAVKMSAGTLNATSELWVGSAANGYGAFTMSGGTANVGSWLAVGRNGNGIINVNGGTLNVTGQNFTTGSFGGAFGVANLTGGTVNVTNTGANQGRFIVGEAGTANLNVSGSATLNISGAQGLHLAAGAGTGIANLNGGTVVTPMVQKGAGTGILNFDGGTLKASAASATFMQGLTAAYVNGDGAVIDDGGFAISVAQPLLAPTGSGIRSVTASGSGFVSAPLVQIIGGGTGATGIANIDADGNLTGITITNPGVGYTDASLVSVTLIGGGGFAAVDPVNLAPNTSGGFRKKGTGTLTLSGANTYTGATVVEAGTLALTGSISGSSTVEVKSGARFDVVGVLGGFSLASGQTLKGNGNVVGSVSMSSGSKLAPGEGLGTLAFNGNLDISLSVTPSASAALLFELDTLANADKVAFASGALTIGTGVLGFDDFAFTSLSNFGANTYTLFDGSSPIVGSLDANVANLTGSLGAGFTGTLKLADNGNDLVLEVVPEPGSAITLLVGMSSLLGLKRFRRRSI